MTNVRIADECFVTCPNETGAGASVLEAAAASGTNLLAFCGYELGDKAKFLIVAEDAETACSAFKGGGFECGWNKVVLVETPNRSGALGEILRKLAKAGTKVGYAYATALGSGSALCVIGAYDCGQAAAALRG